MPDVHPLLLALSPIALLGAVWLIFRAYLPRRISALIRPETHLGPDSGGGAHPPRDSRGAASGRIEPLIQSALLDQLPPEAARLESRAVRIHRYMVAAFAAGLGAFALARALSYAAVTTAGAGIAGGRWIDLTQAVLLLLAPAMIFAMAILASRGVRVALPLLLLGVSVAAALDYLELGAFFEMQLYLALSVAVLVSRFLRPLAVLVLATVVLGGVCLYPAAGLTIWPLFHAFGVDYALDRTLQAWLTGLWPESTWVPAVFVYVGFATLVAAPAAALFKHTVNCDRRGAAFDLVLFACGSSLT